LIKLYLVGPVGEWQDLTQRARAVLRRAELIVVQDVAAVGPRLSELGAQGKRVDSSREDALACILAAAAEGEVAWLVPRLGEVAGPAQQLLEALVSHGVDLVSVPGASALVSGLVAAGLPADRFTALGFVPASPEDRSALWSRVVHDPVTLVCEVAPEDVEAVLREVLAHLGDRRIAVCEAGDVWRGQVSEALWFEWEGPVTLTISGAGRDADWSRERVLDAVRLSLDAGTSLRDTAREVSRRSGWPRRQVYELAMSASRDAPERD
jgi:16S rRNA (cytidine1402-2'-O)-methyltransferase